MMWFETLTGFRELSPPQVRDNISVDGATMTSHINGQIMTCGRLETPSLAELRARVDDREQAAGHLTVREVVIEGKK